MVVDSTVVWVPSVVDVVDVDDVVEVDGAVSARVASVVVGEGRVVVVVDDGHAVGAQHHVELDPARAQFCRRVEACQAVLRRMQRRASVTDNTGK